MTQQWTSSQKVSLCTSGLGNKSSTDQNVGFMDESALLKHELAYCLGQMKNTKALPVLEHVLADEREDPMVRHEVRKLHSPHTGVADV